jgi:hypothetical protein
MVACQAEWKPLCGTHNLLKLWRSQARTTARRDAHCLNRHAGDLAGGHTSHHMDRLNCSAGYARCARTLEATA